MSEENKQPITNFSDRVVYFMGSVDATLRSMDSRLKDIEVNQGKTCPAHEGILHMISLERNHVTEQKAVNANRTVEQTAQDVKIRNLEEDDRTIVARLTPREKTQLNIASIAPIILALWEIVKYVFRISF